MRPGQPAAGTRRRRPRRSREEVSQALIDAAATLFAERSSGHVTVRDIAAKADVNLTFVYRYFGSKRNLMSVAMERAQRHVAARIDEMPDVVAGGPAVFHVALQERELVAAYARAALDGVLDDLPDGALVMNRLLERFLSEVKASHRPGRHDPRIIVTCLTSATVGYALLGRYIRHGTGLDGESDEQVEASLVAVLQDIARLAFAE
jgi:AcrR family transcriptional regulator